MRTLRIALALLPALFIGLLAVHMAHAEGVVFLVRHVEKSLEVEGD